ncbi:serine/threonine/tyrosine-interacting protein B-like [Teratosphaeria destructans]|uniref:Serine/threonine/tyrosine-interacting protein B-like n=1 Tax=Teratosphaeria destructans TaxID=418781 RepID=A0A9W7SNB3_9PEZI|nr:serine/threonine/tyrosine-interacting protein B-like [Teratosphaeria destructans]
MAPADVETFSYPHKTAEYSYRVPTPPRIVVPPPALNSEALPEITLNALRSANFLNGVNLNNIITQNALLEWTYERRREAQMILPYLYLGPMGSAKDEKFLRGDNYAGKDVEGVRKDVTMVLGIRQKHTFDSKVMTGVLRKAQELGVESRSIELAGNQDLIHNFPQTTTMINEHLSRVHRTTGSWERCWYSDTDFIKAMQLVQAQRFCANFDDGLKRLLQGYWDILCAKRQIAEQQQQQQALLNGAVGMLHQSSKRSLSREDEDAAMNGMDQDDDERFGGRSFAPFADQPM